MARPLKPETPFAVRLVNARSFMKRDDFARSLGVAVGTLANWERGRTFPPPDVLVKMAEILDVSLDWLISGRDRVGPGSPAAGAEPGEAASPAAAVPPPTPASHTTMGERIRAVRGNLSQQAFSDLAGVHPKTIAKYESGERGISAEALAKICQAVPGINPEWLLMGSGNRMRRGDHGVGTDNDDPTASLPSPPPPGLGERLRRVMGLFGDQDAAAHAAGVAVPTFRRWVEGTADPSFLGLMRLAVGTGMSLDWLATGQGVMIPDLSQPAPSGQRPTAVSIDEALLGNVVEGLGDFLAMESVHLRPSRHARLIILLYRHLVAVRTEEAARNLRRVELYEPGHPIDPRSLPLVAEMLLTLG